MIVTEIVKEFVSMTGCWVGDLTFCLRIPLIWCVSLVTMKVDLVLGVLIVRIFLCHF